MFPVLFVATKPALKGPVSKLGFVDRSAVRKFDDMLRARAEAQAGGQAVGPELLQVKKE